MPAHAVAKPSSANPRPSSQSEPKRPTEKAGNEPPATSHPQHPKPPKPPKPTLNSQPPAGADVLLGKVAGQIDAAGRKFQKAVEGQDVVQATLNMLKLCGYDLLDPKVHAIDVLTQRVIDKIEAWERAHEVSPVGEKVCKTDLHQDPLVGLQEIQKTANQVLRWADKAQPDGKNLFERDVENARGGAKVMGEVAGHLARELEQQDADERVKNGCDKKFRIRKKGLRVEGEYKHGGSKTHGGFLHFVARMTKKFFKSIRHTSFNVAAGIAVGHYLGNAGPFVSMHFPSLDEAHEKQSCVDAMYLNYGGSVDTVVPFVGWTRRGGTSAGMNLFFLSASYSDMGYGLWVGIPNVIGMSIGMDKKRGPYTSFGKAAPFPLLGGSALMAFPGYALTVYSPFLSPLEKPGRFLAKLFTDVTTKVVGAIRKVFVHHDSSAESTRPGAEPATQQKAGQPGSAATATKAMAEPATKPASKPVSAPEPKESKSPPPMPAPVTAPAWALVP